MIELTRKYRVVHEQYLMEWLMKTYPPGTWQTNVRLGAPSEELLSRIRTPEEARALKPWMAQADAVVILSDKVVIVEALVRPEWWKIFQLHQYAKLFKHTPEFAEHWHKPLELVLLTTQDSPFHLKMAAEYGVRVVIYRPPWLEPYMASLRPRTRRPPGSHIKPA